MALGRISDHSKNAKRKHFLTGLKGDRSLGTYALDLFDWFIKETEDTWAKLDAEEQKYINEQIAAGGEEMNDSGVFAVAYYRKRMRYAHVIFLASLLEGAMKRECERLTIALGDKVLFKPAELKGDPWTARRVFLERHAAFQIPDCKWGSIKDLLAVRNALVHHNGEISLLAQQQVASLRKITGVVLECSEIGIDASYLDLAQESVRNVMEFIHERTNAVIDCAVKPQAVP